MGEICKYSSRAKHTVVHFWAANWTSNAAKVVNSCLLSSHGPCLGVSFPVTRSIIQVIPPLWCWIITACAAHITFCFLVSCEFNLTGKPFIHPDGSAVVYNPAAVASAAGRNPQQGKTLQQLIPAPTQQHQTNHLHSQVSGRDCIFQQESWLFTLQFM